MALPVFPDLLTDKDWQKHKGAIAKMAGETGIGTQMTKAKAAWDKIPWAKFDAAKLCAGMKSIDVYDKAFADAKKEYPKVEPAKKELQALRDLAKKTAEEWKKNKLIPKGSREHVEKIATSADHLAVALKSLDQEFLEVKKRWDANMTDEPTLKKKLGEAVKKTAAELDRLTQEELGKPSDKNWFGRDFLRFLSGYEISVKGKVEVKRFGNTGAKEALTKLVQGMGSRWAVPDDDGKTYDAGSASGGPLEKKIGETLTKDDPLYKVMSLMSQKGLTNYATAFRDAAGVTPPMRFASKQAIPDRWVDTDKWSVDVLIDDQKVTVKHHPVLLEGEGSSNRFKVVLSIDRVLDRASGKVNCEATTFTTKME